MIACDWVGGAFHCSNGNGRSLSGAGHSMTLTQKWEPRGGFQHILDTQYQQVNARRSSMSPGIHFCLLSCSTAEVRSISYLVLRPKVDIGSRPSVAARGPSWPLRRGFARPDLSRNRSPVVDGQTGKANVSSNTAGELRLLGTFAPGKRWPARMKHPSIPPAGLAAAFPF